MTGYADSSVLLYSQVYRLEVVPLARGYKKDLIFAFLFIWIILDKMTIEESCTLCEPYKMRGLSGSKRLLWKHASKRHNAV